MDEEEFTRLTDDDPAMVIMFDNERPIPSADVARLVRVIDTDFNESFSVCASDHLAFHPSDLGELQRRIAES